MALMNGLRNCIVACFLFFFPQLAAAPPNIWIGTWATAPEASIPGRRNVSEPNPAAHRAHQCRWDDGQDQHLEYVWGTAFAYRRRSAGATDRWGEHRCGLRPNFDVSQTAVHDSPGTFAGGERCRGPGRAGGRGSGHQPVSSRNHGGHHVSPSRAANQLRIRRNRGLDCRNEIPGGQDDRFLALPHGSGGRRLLARSGHCGIGFLVDRRRRLLARCKPAVARRACGAVRKGRWREQGQRGLE